MRFRYLVYPESQERLKPLDLQGRLRRIKEKPFFSGYIRPEDVKANIREMQEEGFFKTLLEEERKTFMGGLESVFGGINDWRGGVSWQVHRNGKVLEERTESEDLLLISGWVSSFLLNSNEIWNYKKFGFDSITDFTGCAGASIWELSKLSDYRKGYTWNSKSLDGRRFVNEITGDMNSDLRIFKVDITPDKTIDPTGNIVGYRPEIDDDRKVVAAYHSTEMELLVALLKYVSQTGIEPEILIKDNGKALIDEIKAKGQSIGNTTEHLSPNDTNLRMSFMSFDFPIPILDEEYKTSQHSFDSLGTAAEGAYHIYISPRKELVFSYQKREDLDNPIKPVSVSFEPADINHLIKGVFYQCAMGLGRTPARHMIDALEYRFSPQFEADRREMREKRK